MRYRSRTDIISEILDAANGGATKTKIMYQAFISYSQMKEYLRVLTENNLLNYDLYTQTFKTTEKGLRFLHTYNQMDDMIKAAPLP
ncbi:MAG TPA: winged helix-turn-helix domain-containing protein [Nitrososphaera sp.]|jgi:predicted transcriptional regulator